MTTQNTPPPPPPPSLPSPSTLKPATSKPSTTSKRKRRTKTPLGETHAIHGATSAMAMALAALLISACSASSGDTSPGDVEIAPTEESAEQHVDALAESLTTGDLTKEQSAVVLKLLDDICGDTWCEGDYNWHFPKIVCRFAKGTCTLTFLITDPNPTPPKNYWRSCKVPDARAFTDLVQTAPNGYRSLNDRFYDNVSACVERIETDIRKK